MDRIGTLVKDATNVGPTGSGGPITTGVESDRPSTGARYSPAVLRLAEFHNVDLTLVSGTGLNGRITRKDVQAYIDTVQTVAEPSPERRDEDERVPLTAVRRMIAENMTTERLRDTRGVEYDGSRHDQCHGRARADQRRLRAQGRRASDTSGIRAQGRCPSRSEPTRSSTQRGRTMPSC